MINQVRQAQESKSKTVVFVLVAGTVKGAVGYNALAIPLAAGVLHSLGVLLTIATGALLMSLSTVIVAINARMH